MTVSTTALAATVHDPDGRLLAAMENLAPQLRAAFGNIALNISDATAPQLISSAQAELGAKVMIHAAGETIIGRARRDAVELALGAPQILYADFDHMLRWVEHGFVDLTALLSVQPEVDFLVVGRSARALAAEPRRLQDTERVVNHIYALLAGHAWDLMFAIRRMSARAAETIIDQSRVDTLANDVEWPLLAQRAGLVMGYAESDILFYRTIEEFGAPADTGDSDPLQWIRRVEFAAQHASAMRPFLK